MSRRRVLAAAGAAVVLALVFVLLVAEGDESVVREPPTTVGSSPEPRQTVPTGTATSPEPPKAPPTTPPEVLTNGPRRAVARAVSDLIQAVELGDGEEFCQLVGRSSGDAEGVEALRACGRQAKIDPLTLPSSDELSVAEVGVKGLSAVARLGGGEMVTLEREGGRWRVRSFSRPSG